MPHSFGYRARTRKLFARGFRNHGVIKLSTYLKPYKVGDFVDIKGNGAVHKGMPHKFYHGKTGVVFNVTKSSVGVLINKRVRSRFITKRVNIRIEHVHPSRSREDFLKRVKENNEKRKAAREAGVKISLKRKPDQPRTAHSVAMKNNVPVTLTAIPYDTLV